MTNTSGAVLDVTPVDAALAAAFCRRILPRVSRTFAFNIRLLHGGLGDAVVLAYLFCRIADTLEDSPHLDACRKPEWLRAYRNLWPLGEGWVEHVHAWARDFEPFASCGADHELCARAPEVFAAFAVLPRELQVPIEDCVREMADGMHRFATRKAVEGSLHLEDMTELEEYCHYVAGTVGTMLCRLFANATPLLDAARLERMRPLAARFGLAMQLTNIVKDVADDAARGSFYVPRAVAKRYALRPEEILAPERRPAARAAVRDLVARAAEALDAAVDFTLFIPRREPRLRLFCLWPIFLALRTLGRVLEDDRLFTPGARVRIERDEVRRCLGRTTLAVLSNRAISRLYARERRMAGLDNVGV